MAAGAVYIFAELPVVLHLHATCGAGPDRGDAGGALYLRQTDGLACAQKLQVLVGAAVVVAAVRARAWTFPLPLTLPAELVGLLLISCAYGARHTQV